MSFEVNVNEIARHENALPKFNFFKIYFAILKNMSIFVRNN
jgi:hypothetical protein